MQFTERETLWDTKVKDVLFANFSDCGKVKDLARRQLSIHEGKLAGVVSFFGNDPDLLGSVLATLNPLPVALRSKIITFLYNHRGSLPWVYDLFAQYDLEADPGIKTQMAIGHYRDHRGVRRRPRICAGTVVALYCGRWGRQCSAASGGVLWLARSRCFEQDFDYVRDLPSLVRPTSACTTD